MRYSLHNENAIDLVLFLNGLPVATAELKSDFTQSVDDAMDQYRFDRDPVVRSGQGRRAKPLLGFPSGALVHFAVSHHHAPAVPHRGSGAGATLVSAGSGGSMTMRATGPPILISATTDCKRRAAGIPLSASIDLPHSGPSRVPSPGHEPTLAGVG